MAVRSCQRRFVLTYDALSGPEIASNPRRISVSSSVMQDDVVLKKDSGVIARFWRLQASKKAAAFDSL
jgi:hypothetical protein